MPRVYLSVGSNIKREENLCSAVAALRQRFGSLMISPVYESQPVGFEGDDFYNLVVGFDTDLSLDEVNIVLRGIEDTHGRVRGSDKFSSRTLDLDVLLYGEMIDHTPPRDIPRREITQHAFVLKPLSDIAGSLQHPETGETFAELWRKRGDQLLPLTPVVISL
jgi:2-amino-4-hydroxy-6-hydroxymethyldihydropteridine diphosphokinase